MVITLKEEEERIGLEVVVPAEVVTEMEIDQIPHFARMIDGRNPTSVRIPIMVENGRATAAVEAEDQKVSTQTKQNFLINKNQYYCCFRRLYNPAIPTR